MRHAAPVTLASLAPLALFPVLLLGTAACQAAPERAARAAPAAPRASEGDDARGGLPAAAGAGDRVAAEAAAGPAGPGTLRKPARLGDAVTFSGKALGRHLRAVLNAFVDPAVSASKDRGPGQGKRWVGAGMTFSNIGGDAYGPLGGMWAIDGDGGRHPAVPTGELTTGKALPFAPLAVGEQAEGWVVFEIPENVRVVQLQYRDANTATNSGEGFWQV
ncbi:hypothetical protein [Streptomyces sp. NRRL S-87]|uniref:hypothetical protein n=1 Tax=Streptomyces sp. NRRL S-87 TaxID=1463920 RepID=UPI00068D7724|nr:hypothetical protein [Streptomyces sp. NRRL S-87]